jgi:hypothetical protein
VAILAPRLPRVKEWAYAGIAFDLGGASVSHFAVGDSAANVIAPLVFLAIAAVSWALRPASRVLQVARPRPCPWPRSDDFARRHRRDIGSTIDHPSVDRRRPVCKDEG